MKKSLLALAALGAFVGAAQAQSSVTVYGIYDGGYNGRTDETTTAGAKTTISRQGYSGSAQASSRLGFRGIESIGGGTSAIFNLELGINAGSGAVTVATTAGVANAQQETGVRTSTVGLTNNTFGTLNIGRALTGIHTIVAGTVFGGNNMLGDLGYANMVGGTNYNTQTRLHANATRMSNAVMYTTPTIAGFNARLDYSADNNTQADNTATTNRVGNLGLTGAYVYGPFTVRAGRHEVKGNNIAATAVTADGFNPQLAINTAHQKTIINAFSARYAKDALTVEAIVGNNKTTTDATSLQASKVSSMQLNASYAIGAITPFAKYGIGKTETGIAGAANSDTSGMQAGAIYNMSKRTNLYAAYGEQKIKVASSTTATLVNNKVEGKQVAVGLMHSF